MRQIHVSVVRKVFLLAFCVSLQLAHGFYFPIILKHAFSDLSNQTTDTAEDTNQTMMMKEYSLDCGTEQQDQQSFEQSSRCDLLISTLRDIAVDINEREFCCTLLSSSSIRSSCCHRIRQLCSAYIPSQCPKPRRRILPPRGPIFINHTEDTDNSTYNSTIAVNTSLTSVPVDIKTKNKENVETYYKTKKQQQENTAL